MDGAERVKQTIERGIEAMRQRPSVGRGTATTRAVVRAGLACEIEDGRWSLRADISERGGGGGTAPDPGVYGRSALASCLAVGYAAWAARLEVPIDVIAVTVEADYDVRGEYGVTDTSPGYRAIRCRVAIDSPAPAADVERVVALADRHSPYLEMFRRPVDVTTELTLGPGV